MEVGRAEAVDGRELVAAGARVVRDVCLGGRYRVRTRHVSAQLHVPSTVRGRRAGVLHSQLQASPTVEQDVPYSTWKACAVNALRAKSKAPMVIVFEEGIVVVRKGGQRVLQQMDDSARLSRLLRAREK